MTVFACGILYDDFCDGGFEIVAIVDSYEKALKACEEIHKECPRVDRRDIIYKEYEMNKMYFT